MKHLIARGLFFFLIGFNSTLLLAAPVASLTSSVSQTAPLLGDSLVLNITLNNTDMADSGFFPAFHFILPAEYTYSGTGTCATIGASEINVEAHPIAETDPLDVEDPFTTDTFTLQPGETFISVKPNLGSHAPDQPVISCSFTVDHALDAMTMEPLALAGTTYQIREIQAAYVLGGSVNGTAGQCMDAGADTICSSIQTASISPTVLQLNKTVLNSSNPSTGIGTGPSSPETVSISGTLAGSVTLNNTVVTEAIPEILDVVDPGDCSTFMIMPAPDTCVYTPDISAATGGNIVVEFNALTTDFDIEYSGIYKQFRDDATEILNSSLTTVSETTDVTVDADELTVPLTDSGSYRVYGLDIEKRWSLITDVGGSGLTPGDVIQIFHSIALNDFYEIENLTLSDSLPDGLTYDDMSFTITLDEGGVSTTLLEDDLELPIAYYTHTANGDGTTDIFLDFAAVMADTVNFSFVDTLISGSAVFGGAATTRINLSYTATVDETFETPPASGDDSIDAGDTLPLGTATVANFDVVGGDMGLTVNDSTNPDNGEQGNPTIAPLPATQVEISHIDGNPLMGMGTVNVMSGDEVTFKITVTVPGGDVENLSLTNFLPNPLFLAPPCPTFDAAAVPANNNWTIITPNGASVTDGDITVTCPGGNAINFDFDNFDVAGGAPTVLELLFTSEVSNEPFADGLIQSNMLLTEYDNSSSTAQASSTGVYAFVGDAPDIQITKSVESVDDPNAVISDGDVTDVDAGATLSMLIELENTGAGDAFDVELTDLIPSGYEAITNPATCTGAGCGYSIMLTNCENTTTADTTTEVDFSQIKITNMSIAAAGTCEIRFDLRLSPDNNWNGTFENTASAVYSSVGGGTPFSEVSDLSTVRMDSPSIDSIAAAPQNSGTVGELITFSVTVDVPQGRSTATRAAILETSQYWGNMTPSDYSLAVVGGISGSGPYCSVSAPEVCFANDPTDTANLSITGTSTGAWLDLGEVVNTATDFAGRTVVFSFTAQLVQVPAGVKQFLGQFRYNNGGGNPTITSPPSNFTLNTPNISVIKCSDSTTNALSPISLSDSVIYNVFVRNSGAFISDAFDIDNLSDNLPKGIAYTTDTVNAYYCSAGAAALNATNCATWTPADCSGMGVTLDDVTAAVRAGDGAESSPFGVDERQVINFPIVNDSGEDDIASNAYIVYQITTDVSCESAADSDGVNSPIGSHPDDDGVLDGCMEPVMDFVNTIQNTAISGQYSSLDGTVMGEGIYSATSGASNSLAVDHDNDGISNADEGSGDADSDGVPDYLDTDADDNGTDDATDGTGDNDMDGTPDYRDIDDDNDGVNDGDEITASMGAMMDTDGDMIPDQQDPDADGDGIIDGDEGGIGTDTDSDGNDDYLDSDSDNDGIPDLIEHGLHIYDSDGSGTLSSAEITASGLDTNMDGALSESELSGGSFTNVDGDAQPNFRDLDADDDGVTDLEEAGLGVFDDNNDNEISAAEAADIDDDDSVGDDVMGGANNDNDVLNFDEIPDSDSDGVLDVFDRDSDNDGVYDFVEGGRYICDANNNGFITEAEVTGCAGATDTDTDGYLQADELALPNSDSAAPAGHAVDALADYIDVDSDGDGIHDWIEAYSSNIDTDSNGSISDAEYATANSGGDLLFSELANSETVPDASPDMYDLDSDDDTIYDLHESDAGEIYPTYSATSIVSVYSNLFDSEMTPDGTPDFRDTDSDGDSYLDSVEAGDADIMTIPEANDDPAVPDFQNFSRPDISISKCTLAGTSDPVTLAGNVNYAIHIENTGDRIAYDIDNLVDVLPQGLKYTAGNISAYYCSQGAATDSCGHDVAADPQCVDISAAIIATENVQASPFGMDSRQFLEFRVRDDANMNEIEPDGYYAISIPTEVSCENVADNSGLDFPIGEHPDPNNDGIVDGCTDPVMPGVATIGNVIGSLDYTTVAGTDPDEATYSSATSNTVALNTDHDGDGKLTSDEGTADADMDGVPNYLDTDSDDNGTGDATDSTADSDMDGDPDYIDADDDNDGLSDSEELTLGGGVVDTDMDGIDDSMDPDADGDGFIDGEDGGNGVDTDMDGTEDALDNDSDNDGILDMIEIGLGQYDTNMDGKLSAAEIDASGLDTNMDGAISESELPGGMLPDADNDGTPDYQDTDSDNDGITDLEEFFFGQLTAAQLAVIDVNGDGQINAGEQMDLYNLIGDGDGVLEDSDVLSSNNDSDMVPNHLDTDSDNDGIPDLIEGGRFICDDNNDGEINSGEIAACTGSPDTNMDGVLQNSELSLGDPDADGFFNFVDIDADGDGIGDVIEGHVEDIDGNMDGEISPAEYQTAYGTLGNGDNIMTSDELANSEAMPDALPDYLDTDSDNDGILDLHESDARETYPMYNAGTLVTLYSDLFDSEMTPDGIPDFRDTDSDDDTILDSVEAGDAAPNTIPVDSDMDNIPDFQDTDSDDDGLLDSDEATLMSDPTLSDTDMDGCSDSCEVFGTNPPAEASCPFIGHPSAPGTVMSPISDPADADTDNGGSNDCDEATAMTDPRDPLDDPFIDEDPDNDGLTNGEEAALGTDGNNPDTDGDGCPDGVEVDTYMSDPLADPDSDNDGLTDCQEDGTFGTDRNNPDTDGGGINDGPEVNDFNSNPLDPADDCPTTRDTDGDGVTDCEEIDLGLDPTNPNDATPRGSGTIGFLDPAGCQSSSNTGLISLVLLAIVLFFIRKTGKSTIFKTLLIAGFLSSAFLSEKAYAINVQYLTPKILNPDGHQALSSTTLEPGKYALGAYFTYTKAPLEFGTGADGDAIDDIVKYVFTQDLLLGLGVTDRFSFQVHMPFHIYNDVENFGQFESSREFNVGDLTLQGLIQLRGKNWNAVGGIWGLAFVPFITVPVGQEDRFYGNKDIVGGGYFVMDHWSRLKKHYFTFNLGGRYRPNVESIGALEIGSEVLGKFGYVHRFLNSDGWQLFAELSGSVSLHDTQEVNSPGELFLGVQKISKNERFKWTIGTSRGGNNGYGAPDGRLYTGISYTNKRIIKKPAPPRPKPLPVVKPTPKPKTIVVPVKVKTATLNLKIVDQYGEKRNTYIRVVSDSQSEPLFEGEISELSKTVDEGAVMVFVGKGEKPLRKIYRIKGKSENNYTIVYDKEGKGEKLDLKGKIFFAPGSFSLNEDARAIVLDIYDKIQKAKVNNLVVEAHTDSLGSAESNLELSTERANSVRQYLIQLGMPSAAVSAKGKGEADPIASNKTRDGRALNRRVEFFVK